MTEHTYPLELLRAELGRAISELKVDLIERFVTKADFQQHERDDEQHFKEINEKLDELIGEKKEREAVQVQREKSFSGRWLVLGVVGAFVSGLLVAGATVAAIFA